MGTSQEQISLTDRRAHQWSCLCRHLLSRLNLLTWRSPCRPWRAFTMSTPLRVALGYYAASVLPSTRWRFRGQLALVMWRGRSPVPTRETYIVTRSCLLRSEEHTSE